MDFFKQQAASYLDSSQKDEKKKPAASESEESQQSSGGGGGGQSASGEEQKKAQGDDVPSYQELMSSGNVLMGAAKGKFGGGDGTGEGKQADTDPAKLAAAAHDLIDGAQHYGKLDESSPMGGYLNKAEGYLQSYEKNPRAAEDASATRRDSDDAAPREERRY